MTIDINSLSLKELKDLQSQVAKAIANFVDRKKKETIAELEGQPYPAIIPIPDNQGSQGLGERKLRQNVEKAVGMDILSNQN